jgi:glycoprotease/Kae1 family metallohydrolase
MSNFKNKNNKISKNDVKHKFCLGIESTAHTFGISIVTFNGEILSNVKKSFTTDEGGMIPAKVADHHINHFDLILKESINKAKINLKEISLIAFSNAPGLGNTLKIAQFISHFLSIRLNVPVIGVNHCIAHLEIGRLLSKAKDPILLYASGANTQIIAYESEKYRIFGETLDIGIGNFLDSFARELELGFPGGPKIEQLAKKGKKFIELPYSVKGMDINFGGLLTHLKHKIKQYNKEDLCYSVQETVFAMLIEISERALAHCDKKELLLGGGVACNKRFQEMAIKMCEERGAKCYILENEYNVDNAAMIAWTGILMYNNIKNSNIYNLNDFKSKNNNKLNQNKINFEINPYERTDEVIVYWRD